VTRERATEDRRQVNVTLTKEGGSVLAGLAKIHRRELRERSTEMIAALKRLQK
jgi:DNA-binding MarR family transcriptional regulator